LSLREPLRVPIFRNLVIADLVSDVGTFMQGVGAAWLMVSLGAGPVYVQGPVLVTVEYVVLPEREAEFLKAIHRYGRTRRRNGAYRWGVFRDTEAADHYVEVFLLETWAEHLRQHERQTRADHELERRLRGGVAAEPTVHHLIYSHLKD
jgi:hypothetical protein